MLSAQIRFPTSPFDYLCLVCNTVDSRYNKLLGPSEITLLYRNFVISGLQKQLSTKKL